MLTIAYIGNFRFTHCTEVHVSKSLQSLGCDVIQYQEDQTSADAILDSLPPSVDMILWTRTWGLADGWRLLERAKVPTVGLSLDLYAGLDRSDGIDKNAWWKSTYVFTADGGHDLYWRDHGVNHFWLKAAVFDRECYLAEPVEKYKHDVAFIGVGDPSGSRYHPEWPYRSELIKWLYEKYGGRLFKAGFPQPTVRDHSLNQVYASVKVVVGDTLCLGFNHPNYWSDRVYETLGRGGFLIHPYVPGMEQDFTNGEHLRYYRYADFKELKDLIDYYVTHDEERERIRRAGHEHVKAHHTYVHRMREMLSVVFPDRALELDDRPSIPSKPKEMIL